MPREERQPFTATGGYVARKQFRFHGKPYAPGDNFPWRQLSCSVRKLRQLYEQRYIEPKGDGASVEEKPEEETTTQETTTQETTTPEAFEFDPDVHTIDREDGKWYVCKGSKRLLQITPKEGKRLDKRVNPDKVRPDEIVQSEE